MTRLEARMASLEKKIKYLEERLKISSPDRPKFGSMHIGKKSKEVLIQEGFSLQNRFKPQTFSKSELSQWSQAYALWRKEASANGAKELKEIESKIEEMLHPR